MIRIGSVFQALKRVDALPKTNNISKLLYPEGKKTVDLSLDSELIQTFRDRPYLADQVDSINMALANPKVAKQVPTRAFEDFYRTPESIKNWHNEIDSIKRSEQMSENFIALGGVKKNKRQVLNYARDKIRTAEYQYKQTSPILENNIRVSVIDNLPKALRAEGGEAFDLFVAKPQIFKEKFNLDQDEVLRHLLGESSSKIESNLVLKSLVKSFEDYDNQVLGFVQELGVNVGQLDNFVVPMHIPKDAFHFLGYESLKNIFETHVDMDEAGIKFILNALRDTSDSTTKGTSINFYTRNMKFNSAQDELDFYRKVNLISDDAPMIQLLMQHKQRLIKKAALINQFGNDPIKTFNRSVDSLSKGANAEDLKNIRDAKKAFEHLIDAYEGKMHITSYTAEQIRQAVSLATSITTGSTSSGTIRNFVTDFNWNLASTGQAAYNPKYGIGSASIGTVKDFGGILRMFPKMFKREKGFVKDVLNSMDFAISMDSLTHYGLVNFEDVYDISVNKGAKGLNKLIDILKKGNDIVYTFSGQHSLIDFRRFRQIMSFQNMWLNNLKRYSYDEWYNSLDDLGKKQLDYLKNGLGLGEKEFSFLKEANRIPLKHKKNSLELLSRESILETPNEIAKNFTRVDETVKDFKIRVSNVWQKLIYLNVHDAAPIPISIDGMSKHTYGANSWVRLLLSPLFKFGDVAQSQWKSVIDRVSLNIYGDKSQAIGFDKSIAKYMGVAGIYTGSAIGVQWLNDLTKNRKATDMTNPSNTLRTLLGSGFGGYGFQFLSGVMNLYPSRHGGSYSSYPVAKPVKSALKILDKADKGGPEFWNTVAEEMRNNSGIGNIWYLRGLLTKSLQKMILSPAQQRSLTRRQERAMEGKNRKEKEFWGIE